MLRPSASHTHSRVMSTRLDTLYVPEEGPTRNLRSTSGGPVANVYTHFESRDVSDSHET